ncbi:hypothetical protein AYL99_11911 [Fonsecaea erecta]|uniref:Uncharacterized protein n=1 Tax=Fonsecaea erecta TaxID=1367422 RepID=A0A178Z270_9EURO|nr:hypothetical protein AYL99_11911 [Fonsecaea erecta]OAP53889.1 hypothetical protein AYL99_11911 [Fonsecaea erecta]
MPPGGGRCSLEVRDWRGSSVVVRVRNPPRGPMSMFCDQMDRGEFVRRVHGSRRDNGDFRFDGVQRAGQLRFYLLAMGANHQHTVEAILNVSY